MSDPNASDPQQHRRPSRLRPTGQRSLPPSRPPTSRAHCGATLGGNCAPARSSSSRDPDLRLLDHDVLPESADVRQRPVYVRPDTVEARAIQHGVVRVRQQRLRRLHPDHLRGQGIDPGRCFATAFTMLVGGFHRVIAGFFGGWVDSILSRLTDIFFGIPLLLGGILV